MSLAFLDANVLFSAAYREKSRLVRLWNRPGAELVTSAYAAEEARKNLTSPDQRARLESLLSQMRIVAESDAPMPASVKLHDRDHPILKAAIAAEATHLITGNVKDFCRYLGTGIAGVLVVTPAGSSGAEEEWSQTCASCISWFPLRWLKVCTKRTLQNDLKTYGLRQGGRDGESEERGPRRVPHGDAAAHA